MSVTPKALTTGIIFNAAITAALISPLAQADQYVADLVPSTWDQIERQVVVRQKMYSANLYGDLAHFQIMLESSGQPTAFDIGEIAVNGDDLACRAPNLGEDIGNLSFDFTRICTFTPELTFSRISGGVTVLETARDYWMRIKFNNAANRSVQVRYEQPEERNCSSTNPIIANACDSFQKTVSLGNNQIKKPSEAYNGLQWVPLALKNNSYHVKLVVSGGKVLVENGLKLKVSGSPTASPNDELLAGAEFSGTCDFEQQVTLPNGTYECDFLAEDDGFIHLPLKRSGTSGTRQVAVTITNTTTP